MSQPAGDFNKKNSAGGEAPAEFLFDGVRLAQMTGLHSDPSAAIAYVFHGGKLVFAYVFGVCGRSPAEAALAFVAAGIAKMSGLIGHRATGLAGISHDCPPWVFDSPTPSVLAAGSQRRFASPRLPKK
jgi:hypothetical protein